MRRAIAYARTAQPNELAIVAQFDRITWYSRQAGVELVHAIREERGMCMSDEVLKQLLDRKRRTNDFGVLIVAEASRLGRDLLAYRGISARLLLAQIVVLHPGCVPEDWT